MTKNRSPNAEWARGETLQALELQTNTILHIDTLILAKYITIGKYIKIYLTQ